MFATRATTSLDSFTPADVGFVTLVGAHELAYLGLSEAVFEM